MNKYLIEILKIQSSIILPGLGALMVPSQKSGTIVFNQHLKFNDGSFARYIAEKDGIDEQDAQNKVAKFVREIEAELGKGNSYDMFEFGKFFKTAAGDVDFKMYNDNSDNEAEEKEVPVEKKKTPALSPAAILADQPTASKSETDKATDKKLAEEKIAKEKKAKEKEAEEKQKRADADAAAVQEALRLKKEAEDKASEEAKRKSKEEEAGLKKAEEEKIAANLAASKIEESKKTIEEVKEEVKEIKPINDAKTTSNEEKINLDKHSKNSYTPPVDSDPSHEGTTVEDNASSAPIESTATATTLPPPAEVMEEKKKRSKLPWLILLLLLIGLGVAGFFYKDQILAYFDKEEHKSDLDSTEEHDHTNEIDETVTEIDTVDMEEMATEELPRDEHIEEVTDEVIEDVIEEPLPVATTGTNNGTYHLIGNSFSEEENANRYMEKMKGKGYPAKIIGRYDGLYLVSLKSYDSRQDAESGKSSVTADAGSAWVFNKP